jgi:hypothetical protein
MDLVYPHVSTACFRMSKERSTTKHALYIACYSCIPKTRTTALVASELRIYLTGVLSILHRDNDTVIDSTPL